MIYNDTTLRNLNALTGASHSFAKQMVTPEAEGLRALVEEVRLKCNDELSSRLSEKILSMDNCSFFQGLAEAVTIQKLTNIGWKINGLNWPGPTLNMTDPKGTQFKVLTMAYVQQRNKSIENDNRDRLRRSLNRIQTDKTIGIVLRKPLTNPIETDNIRRAIEMWLQKIESPTRAFAYYENEAIWLEIGITGQKKNPEDDVVQFFQGPIVGDRFLNLLETDTIEAIEKISIEDEERLLISWVSNQPFPFTLNALRFFLFGPTLSAEESDKSMERKYTFDTQQMIGFFVDPYRRNIAALLQIERKDEDQPEIFTTFGLPNPWFHGDQAELPANAMSVIKEEVSKPMLGWKDATRS